MIFDYFRSDQVREEKSLLVKQACNKHIHGYELFCPLNLPDRKERRISTVFKCKSVNESSD